MNIKSLLRPPTDPVLRKIIVLAGLVIVTAGILIAESYVGQAGIARCGGLYDNQHARRSLGRCMCLTLARLESAVRQLAAEDDARSAAFVRGRIPEMIGHLEDALATLSHGGVHEHIVRLNLQDSDAFHETISYRTTNQDRIVIEVVELAPKLAGLEASVARLAEAVEERITATDQQGRAELDHVVTLRRKQAEAILLRAAENVNKIYYDTSQRLIAIERENKQMVARIRLVQNITAGVLVLVCLTVGATTFRAVARILRERRNALSDLKKHHDQLDELITDRTAELREANAHLQQEIADRKQAEQALRENEQRLKGLLNANPAGIVVIDSKTHRIVEANPVALDLFGAPREHVVGHTCHKHICPAETGQCPITDLGQRVDKAERVLITADSGELPILKTVVPIVLDGRQCLLESFIDISDLKQAEAQRNVLNKQLQEASRNAGMAEVATGVLHNVGNVLNSVNVSASVIADRMRKSKAQSLTKAVELIDQHTDDLAAFITQDDRGKHLPRFLATLAETMTNERASVLEELRSLTRNINHIKTIVNTQQSYAGAAGFVEPVSLADLIDDALKMNEPSFQRYSIEVVRDYADSPSIEAEKQKLLQILINLLRNAKHALVERPGEDRRLTLQVRSSGDDRVRVEVIDNGVGISAENLTRIFAYGFTTKGANGGRGFGLHHSALLAQEMGGTLTADSNGPGTGATFTLELPRVYDENNASPGATENTESQEPAAKSGESAV